MISFLVKKRLSKGLFKSLILEIYPLYRLLYREFLHFTYYFFMVFKFDILSFFLLKIILI
jgi:hypothetical protein